MTDVTTVAPWRLFAGEVRQVRELSRSFVRVTVTGPDLDTFADNGYDQRFKLVLPAPGPGVSHLPAGPDWFPHWRGLPDGLRCPIRTYTVRYVRPADREVDVDMVRHADGHGPASRWLAAARKGEPLALVGPDAGYPGDHGGIEFRPGTPATTGGPRAPGAADAPEGPEGPEGLEGQEGSDASGGSPGRPVLIAGDETAVPAVAAILERLPEHSAGDVLLEIPYPDDVLPLDAPPGLRVHWLPRSGDPHGSRLVPAVRAAAAGSVPGVPAPEAPEDIDVDRETLWESAAPGAGGAGVYAWLAGEAGVIRTLRRHLVTECGLDRRSVAFMGYWRLGRAEAG